MKQTTLIVTLAILASAATSAAADSGSAAKWDGFYAGGSLGYGAAKSDLKARECASPWCDPFVGDKISFRNTGSVAGVFGGMNYQRGALVYGVEASAQWSNVKESGILYGEAIGDDWMKSKMTSVVTLAGRVGQSWGQSLAYVKGGLATARFSLKANDNEGINVGAGSDSEWRNGYLLGLGYEYAFNQNWSAGIDYSYIRLRSAKFDLSDSQGAYSLNQGSNGLELLIARISYKF